MPESQPLWSLNVPGLAIAEFAPAVCVLRVRAPDAALIEALGQALGIPWPGEPNTVTDKPARVAWLAPGEWAIFLPADQVQAAIAPACQDRLHHLADVSAGRRLWRVEGTESRALMAKGCGLDLHPRVLGPGHCAQSYLAAVPALIIPQDESGAFDVLADATVCGHLRAWFTDAALEFRA